MTGGKLKFAQINRG